MGGNKHKASSKRSRTSDPEILDQNRFQEEKFCLTNNDQFFPDLVRKLYKLVFYLNQYLQGLKLCKLTNLFNFQVWNLVASKFNTPTDIENFSNAGYYFRKFVGKKRETEVVLPKVFEILAERYAHSDSKYYKETKRKSIT